MVDLRTQIVKTQRRVGQWTGEGAKKGLFVAYIDAASGDDQSGTFLYDGGARDITLPMPYDGNTSWIRAIPDSGTPVLAGYRADINDTICINYLNPSPSDKLDGYTKDQSNLYRPLQPGEIEINSTGMAQSYYSVRPILDQKAGVVRSWLDGDRLESGAKAPLHLRQLWEYKSAPLIPTLDDTGTYVLLGDEERFGVVRRPYNFYFDPTTIPPTPRAGIAASAAATAAAASATAGATAATASGNPDLAAQLTQLALNLSEQATLTYSFNYFDYPFPNFTTPTGIANPSTVTTAQAAAATAGTEAALAVGGFEPRVFAKEYVRIINNPLFNLATSNPTLAVANPPLVAATSTLLNPRLIDFREGQVFDDEGVQTIGPHGAYLRAAYNYFSPVGDSTQITIDEVGNVGWVLSSVANFGWSVLIPTGGMLFNAASAISATCTLGNIDLITTIGTIGLDSGADITMTSAADMSFTTGGDFTHNVLAGDYTVTVTDNYSISASMNASLTATTDFTATATNGTMSLTAPMVNIGNKPEQSAVLGDLLSTWLNTLITTLLTGAPDGNLGAPVLFASDPALVASLQDLQSQIEELISDTVMVSP